MKVPDEIKLKIQSFVYFLFKGTIDHRLIVSDFNYLDKLLNNKDLLYNCFEVFAYAMQRKMDKPSEEVSNYILSLHSVNKETTNIQLIKDLNKDSSTYWKDFLVLAKCFCFNSFPNPLSKDYIKDLDGCGTDAVPPFAVWTNVIEIDENSKVVNPEFALKRANQRMDILHIESSEKFADWELEQEIY